MKYGDIMYKARLDSGKSRDFIAEKMGVTYKTVWSWENNLSHPQVNQFFDWFSILGINVKSYLNSKDSVSYDKKHDKQITDEIKAEIDSYTHRRKCLLHFLLLGKHGADIDAELNKEVCHLQTDWHGRVSNTILELTNYRLAKSEKEYGIKPDTDLVHRASVEASKCIISGNLSYSLEKKMADEYKKADYLKEEMKNEM